MSTPMIVKADLALYKAKELGKNDWRLFEAAMDAAFRNRQLMKADLRSGDRGQGAARRLSADRGDGHDAHRQLRGAVPLGPSRARADLAGGLHPARRGDGHHFRDQHLRAATAACANAPAGPSRPASRSICRPRISATATSSRRCATALAESGLAAAPAGDRGHRDGAARRQVADAAVYRGAEAARRPHRARRFRHRLFEPELSAQAAARQDQDRPQLPDRRHPEQALARTAEGHRQPVAAARPDASPSKASRPSSSSRSWRCRSSRTSSRASCSARR